MGRFVIQEDQPFIGHGQVTWSVWDSMMSSFDGTRYVDDPVAVGLSSLFAAESLVRSLDRLTVVPKQPQQTDEDIYRPSSPPFSPRVQEIMAQRRASYAHPQDNHELTARLWCEWINASRRYRKQRGDFLDMTAEDVCVLNILQKLSRLAWGTHDDSLMDIVGYVECIAMLGTGQRNRNPSTEENEDESSQNGSEG